MHFCGGLDDLLYLVMFLPGMSLLVAWVRAKFHHDREHKDCNHV